MKYDIEFKPKAFKDIEAFLFTIQTRVLARIERMSDNLTGDVKRLTEFTSEYRLRVGDYRVLFEIDERLTGEGRRRSWLPSIHKS